MPFLGHSKARLVAVPCARTAGKAARGHGCLARISRKPIRLDQVTGVPLGCPCEVDSIGSDAAVEKELFGLDPALGWDMPMLRFSLIFLLYKGGRRAFPRPCRVLPVVTGIQEGCDCLRGRP